MMTIKKLPAEEKIVLMGIYLSDGKQKHYRPNLAKIKANNFRSMVRAVLAMDNGRFFRLDENYFAEVLRDGKFIQVWIYCLSKPYPKTIRRPKRLSYALSLKPRR